jgi:transposase, IS30 family
MERQKYTHLTAEERYQISALSHTDIGTNEIARRLGRHRSSISRELARNKGLRGYRPKQANEKAIDRRSAVAKQVITAFGWSYVEHLLRVEKWSPEQIHGRLTHLGWKDAPSSEHIYRRVYADLKAGGKLRDCLRGRKKYRKRYGSGQECRGRMPNRRDIDERDPVIEKRERVGDFEGDTVMGAKHQGAIVTLVDRKSLLLQAKALPNKAAAGVAEACISLLAKKPVHTITFDNGTEFSQHEYMASSMGTDIYFAKPYSSWQRGRNENTNGLLREYFPKKMPLHQVQDEAVQKAVSQLNNRPRKTLGWKTPAEVWSDG